MVGRDRGEVAAGCRTHDRKMSSELGAGQPMIATIGLALFGFSGVVLAPLTAPVCDPQNYSKVLRHLPSPPDQVVWVNAQSSVFHLPSDRRSGHKDLRSFECEKRALQAGDRETRIGK